MAEYAIQTFPNSYALALTQNSEITRTQSVQGAVATWSVINMRFPQRFETPFVDQVATAPCTDGVQ